MYLDIVTPPLGMPDDKYKSTLDINNLRVHGNGFMQVPIVDRPNWRLHIWHPDIIGQNINTPIHDHTYGFTSQILLGALVQKGISVFRNESGCGNYNIYEARPTKGTDTKLVPPSSLDNDQVWIRRKYIELLEKGDRYEMSPFEFHEAHAIGHTASVMYKGIQISGYNPRVLVPVGVEPDNGFQREEMTISQRMRYVEIIRETIKLCE